MRKASGENFTIDVEHGVAIARVHRRPDLDPTAIANEATHLLSKAKSLILDDVTGLVLDVRRVPGAVSPTVEQIYAQLLAAWEASGQPVAILVEDPVQRMQLSRLVSRHSPRFGGLFSDREEARRFAGASSVEPSTAITGLHQLRPSKIR